MKKIISQIKWNDNHNFLQLAIKIAFGIKSNKNKENDSNKGNAKFPSFEKYKPMKFEVPSNIPFPQFQSHFTILQLPINPDKYVHFSLPVLESIQALQEAGFVIPQAKEYDI